MRIANDAAHRALAYVAAVRRQGYPLTAADLEAYMPHPDRKAATIEALLAARGSFFEVLAEPAESITEWLARLHWVTTTGDQVDLSDLGRAVLRDLDEQDIDAEQPLRLALDPKDPLSYARVIGRMAELGEAMLVDRFFGLDHLLDVMQRTSITRVLMGPKNKGAIATALSRVSSEREFSVRVSDEIHDRFVIPSAGIVEGLGTSLSGVGKRFSVMVTLEPPIADRIRAVHEDLWRRAEHLLPPTSGGSS